VLSRQSIAISRKSSPHVATIKLHCLANQNRLVANQVCCRANQAPLSRRASLLSRGASLLSRESSSLASRGKVIDARIKPLDSLVNDLPWSSASLPSSRCARRSFHDRRELHARVLRDVVDDRAVDERRSGAHAHDDVLAGLQREAEELARLRLRVVVRRVVDVDFLGAP